MKIILSQKYVEAGADPKKQQQFQNVTHPPLITASLEKLILESLNVPELHLLLGTDIQAKIMNLVFIQLSIGVVEKLLKEFERNVFSTRDLGKTFMNNYLKKVDYWTS